jgi:hypothetical protein
MLKVGVHYNQGIDTNAGEKRVETLADRTTEPTLALARRAMDHGDALISRLQFTQHVNGVVVRVVHEEQAPFAIAEG